MLCLVYSENPSFLSGLSVILSRKENKFVKWGNSHSFPKIILNVKLSIHLKYQKKHHIWLHHLMLIWSGTWNFSYIIVILFLLLQRCNKKSLLF